MTELSEIYIAIRKRILTLRRTVNQTELESELRLDIENVLDLLSKELNVTLYKDESE